MRLYLLFQARVEGSMALGIFLYLSTWNASGREIKRLAYRGLMKNHSITGEKIIVSGQKIIYLGPIVGLLLNHQLVLKELYGHALITSQ